jgi:Na+/phosphate symporter
MIDVLFLEVIGGVFLLLYGVRSTGQGFELAFGEKLSRFWSGPGWTLDPAGGLRH